MTFSLPLPSPLSLLDTVYPLSTANETNVCTPDRGLVSLEPGFRVGGEVDHRKGFYQRMNEGGTF